MSQTQSLAQAKAGNDIRALIASPKFKDQVALALPKHLTADRFSRVILTAMTRTPKLLECTQPSLLSCCMTLSQLGLEPDGRRAHLIPYYNNKQQVTECQLIIDWKGLAELAMRSGLVSTLHADVVREGDIFEYNAGDVVRHVPHFLRRDADKPEQAGNVYAVYSSCVFTDGGRKSDVLSIEEVEAVRKRSKSGNSGPWVTDFNEMAKKTAFRRLSKWLPLSPEFRDAVEADDEIQHERAVQVREVPPQPAWALPAEPVPASVEFWDRVDQAGWADTDVMAVLRQQKVTSGEYPADLANGEAETALGLWDQLKGLMK